MICAVWDFAQTNDKFGLIPPDSLDMTIARFAASMFMHINVEKDVKNGISYMKYCLNHHHQFTNPYAAFIFGLL